MIPKSYVVLNDWNLAFPYIVIHLFYNISEYENTQKVKLKNIKMQVQYKLSCKKPAENKSVFSLGTFS